MSKLLNIDAETSAMIADDDAEPTLTLTNSSTAPGLEVDDLVVTSGATIAVGKLDVNTPLLVANATITGIDIRGASVASGAALAFSGDSLVSCTSIKFITGGVAGTKAIRIVQADGTFAWIPVLPDAAVTAAAL